MTHPIRIRTVLDARSRSSKYLFQVLLLAASWHRHVRRTAPLEVLVIDELPRDMRRFLTELGAQIRTSAPDPNDYISRTSNTIVGACDTEGQRILLVDNDVVFQGDLSDLCETDSQYVMGSIAGQMRVNDSQWSAIREHFGCGPLSTNRCSLRELIRAAVEPEYQPKPLANVYVNGGVLLLPVGEEFGPLWRRCVREIGELFKTHPLRNGSVYGSNMAGLAMAIAKYGKFFWLDTRFNYRAGCFALGLEPPERIEIVHLTGLNDTHRTVTRRIEYYWQQKMIRQFSRATSPALSSEDVRIRLDVIESQHHELLSLIDEYDLDRRSRQLPVDFGHLWKSKWHRRVAQPFNVVFRKTFSSAAQLRRRLAASTADSGPSGDSQHPT